LHRPAGIACSASLIALACAALPAHAKDDPASVTVVEPENEDGQEVIVTGRAAKLYRVDETSAGKLPTEPLASSQAITVITKELIRDQGARDAQDLYRNISGVSLFSYAGVTARGFRQQENFYDGLRGDPYIGFTVPQLFNIERVEFLKGPAGMLYGQTAPGGLFNYVTKKPDASFGGNIGGVIGTADRWGGQAEVSGPITDSIGLRAGAFYESRGLLRDFATSKTTILDGGATFAFGPAKLTLQALHIDQDLDGNRLRGVPATDDGRFLGARTWNHNERSDFLDLASDSVYARLDLELATGLTADVSYRHIEAEERQKYHEPIGLIGPAGAWTAVSREYRDQIRDSDTDSVAGNIVWSTDLGSVKNRLLVGYDYSVNRLDFRSRASRGGATVVAGRPTPLSITTPAYGVSNPATYVLPAYNRTITDAERQGYYLLDEVTIGRLILTAGIRRDAFEDVNTAATTTRFAAGETTWRVGAAYRVRADVSLFGQYATSFEPQGAAAQEPRAGGPFAPTSGDIIEGGIKTALFGGRAQSSLSAYRIRRSNILQADPRGDPEGDGLNNSVAFGEVTSKGFDLDLAADLTNDWVLTLTYAYNDTRVTKATATTPTGFTNNVGNRFANAPEHQLGFWTRYQFPKPGIAFALGGDYVSERISLSNQTVRPYMIFDASVILTRGDWRALIRVDNLFDKTYAASGFIDRNGHFPGRPRTGFLELSRSF
jgi:iron complex outermembrane receptor protein